MDVKEDGILGKNINHHWYYVSKGRAMRTLLRDVPAFHVLDVGAGSGVFSRQLIDEGLCDEAICVDPNYVEERVETHRGKRLFFVKSFNGHPPNLVLMMDVLEHVPDDLALLRQYTDGISSGGHVLISVPAFQFMWSGHDVFLEHYRRYRIPDVEAIVKNAGLLPLKTRYFFASLFPLIAMIRLVKRLLIDRGTLEPRSDLAVYPEWLNSLLVAIHGIERRAFLDANRLFGLTVFCLCRKP